MSIVDNADCLPCPERYEAIARGAFWWSNESGAWLWSGSIFVLRRWRTCPWCDGLLPDLTRPYHLSDEGFQ